MEVHCSFAATEQLFTVSGFDGGLPACPHPGKAPEIPPILLREGSLPVQVNALRTDGRPPGVHQAVSCCGGTFEMPGGGIAPLSGRHLNQVVVLFRGTEGSGGDTGLSAEGGVLGQHPKESHPSNTDTTTPWSLPGYGTFPDFLITGPSDSIAQGIAQSQGVKEGSSGRACDPTGFDGVLPRRGPMVKVPLKAPSEIPKALPPSGGTEEQEGCDIVPLSQRQPTVVVGHGQVGSGLESGTPAETGSDHGCVTTGLGGTLTRQDDTGHLVASRGIGQHQLPGAQGSSAGSEAFCSHVVCVSRIGENGQHDSKGIPEQTGGHTLQGPGGGSFQAISVGREAHSVNKGRACGRRSEHHSRLAKSAAAQRGGMAPTPRRISSASRQVGAASNRSLCQQDKQAGRQVYGPGTNSRRIRSGRTTVSVAQGAALCLSSNPSNSHASQKNTSTRGGSNSGGPMLATQALVSGRAKALPGTRVEVAAQGGSSDTRPGLPSTSRAVPTNSLEVERQALASLGYSPQVVETLLASKRVSTARTYNSTWKRFRSWCLERGFSPVKFSTETLLDFLQDGKDMGLSASTLRRQVAALKSTLGAVRVPSALSHPHVSRFIRAVKRDNPPVVHRFPSWDLHLVLMALEKAPFEPLESIDLKYLTYKTILLVAITSARRVSEIGALSTNPNLCTFHEDRVVFRVDPAFVPKVNSWFHRAQDIVLPSFCPRPSSQLESDWHNLDVRRVVQFYIDRTKAIRRTDSLFVHFKGPSVGLRPSRPTLARWMKGAIVEAYLSLGKIPPAGITAHSVRSAATSAAFEGVCSLEAICRAATWANPSTFIKHYKIDVAASAEAAFGRRVLQSVVKR